MRTLHFLVLAITLAGCPKNTKITTTAPMSTAETEIRATEQAIASLYEEFMELCRREISLGQEQWTLGCLPGGSVGYAIQGYPANACTDWMWFSQGRLTRQEWARMIVDNDRAYAELKEVWDSAPPELRSYSKIEERGMNPWVIDRQKEWQCPPLPSTP